MMLLPSPPPRGYPSGRASPFPRTQRLLLKRYDINFYSELSSQRPLRSDAWWSFRMFHGGVSKLKLSEFRLRRKLKEDNGQQQNLLENDGNVRYLPPAAVGLTSDNFC